MKARSETASAALPPATSAEILAEHAVPGVEEIHGVTFDGTHVWFAGGPDQDLFCVEPHTGKLVKRLGRSDCAAGLTFDGEHLWQICGEHIHQIERANGKTLRTIPVPPGCHCSGLAFAAGSLWVGDFQGRAIHRVDPADGRVLRTLRSERLVTGVTWAGSELWHGTYPEGDAASAREPGELRRIDAESGAVEQRLHLPAGTLVSGTEFDGRGRIWLGSRQGRVALRAVRKP